MDEINPNRISQSGVCSGSESAKQRDCDLRTDTTFSALASISNLLKSVATSMQDHCAQRSVSVDLVGDLQGLSPLQPDLQEVFDDENYQVRLNFTLTGKSPQVFEFIPQASLGDINRVLRQDDIQILGSRRLASNFVEQPLLRLELAGRLPASASFQSNPNFGEIIFKFKNLGTAGEQVWYISPEAVDVALLKKLQAFLLEGDNEFFELNGVHRDPQEETTPVINLGDNALDIAEAYKAEVLCFNTSRKLLEKRLELNYWGDSVFAGSDCRELRIGRRPPVELKIASRFVSRLHATIIAEKNTFTLRDHSSNGTYIKPDGKPVFSIRYSSHVLLGSGVISLGEELETENPHLIYYRII